VVEETSWTWYDNGAKLHECGLVDGTHVWVDVGDGDGPMGLVGENKLLASRSTALRPTGLIKEEREGSHQVRLVRTDVVGGGTEAAQRMNIIGEEQLLEPSERLPDTRPTVTYSETVHRTAPIQMSLAAYTAAKYGKSGAAPGAGDDGGGEVIHKRSAGEEEVYFDAFKRLFELVNVTDMTGHKDWMSDVRGTLWSRFDLILYIFECHSPTDGSDETEIEAAADAAPSPNGKKKQKKKGGSSTPSPAPSSGIGRRAEIAITAAEEGRGEEGTISLLEVWEFARRCALTSPYLAIVDLDAIVPDHHRRRKKPGGVVNMELFHSPDARVDIAEFIELIVRLAVHMQEKPAAPDVAPKDAIKALFDLHIGPQYETYPPAVVVGSYGLEPLEPLHPSVRRILRTHKFALRSIFAQRAADDETGATMRVREVVNLLDAARLTDETLTKLDIVDTFAAVVVGGTAAGALAAWKKRHTPDFPTLPEPKRDSSTGRLLLNTGGGLLVWEWEELIARIALHRFRADTSTPDPLKVNEVCQLLRAGPGMLKPRPAHPLGAAPSFLPLSSPIIAPTSASPAMDYVHEQSDMARLMLATPHEESNANAQRVAAVKGLLKVPAAAAPAPKAEKGGGKKKK